MRFNLGFLSHIQIKCLKCCPLCSPEPSSTQTETSKTEGDSCETADVTSPNNDRSVDQPELSAPSEESTSFEQDNGKNSNSEEGLPSTEQVASSSSNVSDLSTEGDADNSDNTETAIEPGEHD